MSLDEALEKWSVFDPGMFDDPDSVCNWYAVANDDGIIAYSATETDAYRWRLTMINRDLNP